MGRAGQAALEAPQVGLVPPTPKKPLAGHSALTQVGLDRTQLALPLVFQQPVSDRRGLWLGRPIVAKEAFETEQQVEAVVAVVAACPAVEG